MRNTLDFFFFLEHNWWKSAAAFCSVAATALFQRMRPEGLTNRILCHCPIKKSKIKVPEIAFN